MSSPGRDFKSFKEFWPFYLSQHQNPKCQALHFWGTTLGFLIFSVSILSSYRPGYLIAFLVGYGFAWMGHFLFEKNQPATFRYPLYSLRADLKMFWLKWQAILKRQGG